MYNNDIKPDTSFDIKTGNPKTPEWSEIFELTKKHKLTQTQFQQLWDRTVKELATNYSFGIRMALIAFKNALLDLDLFRSKY